MSLSKNQISVDKHFMNNVIQEMNKTIEKLYIELDKKDNIIAKQTKEIENQLRVINTANEGVFEKYRINKKDFLYDFQKGNCCYCNRKVSKKKMTKEHLGISLALNLPVIVVFTKIDLAPENVFSDNIKKI